MMDLDSAIQHCKEQVQEQAKKGCYSCAEEHQQLAEWLKELKAYRSRSEIPNTCGDAISRQAVMDYFRKWQPYMATRLWDFEQELSELPPVTPQQRTGRWIPVSERLPEERKKCLVAFKGGYVGIMCYASDLYRVDEYDFCDEKGMAGWFDYDRELGHYSRDDVIAWMPLPEPYKAESEVDS